MILASENYVQGMTIRLCACNTGAEKDSSSYAQQLANILGVDVIAPTAFYFPGIPNIKNAVGGRIGLGAFGAKIPFTTPEIPWVTFSPEDDEGND